jgi:hypothetical protein
MIDEQSFRRTSAPERLRLANYPDHIRASMRPDENGEPAATPNEVS